MLQQDNAFMSGITLWGFDGSTYVRTVRMLLAEKGITQFKQVPLNVLEGEPKIPSIWSVIRSARFQCSTMMGCASSRLPQSPAISTTSCRASR
jgi:hypothetical protein